MPTPPAPETEDEVFAREAGARIEQAFILSAFAAELAGKAQQ